MSKSNIIKLITTYISIILGAGFISGKELFFFFGKYRNFGIFTLFISCLIFLIVLNKQLFLIKRYKLNQYHDFSKFIFGKKISSFIELITLLFLFITASTMISAFCQAINDSFSIKIIISQIIIFFIILYFLINGIEKIVLFNTFITPIMFFGIILIGIYLIQSETEQTFNFIYTQNFNYINAIIFSLLYTSFNSLNVIPMMCNMSEYIDSKKTIYTSSCLSGVILFILGLFLLYPLIINYNTIESSNIPILTLLSYKSSVLKFVYLIVLVSAIISTLLSSSISFLSTIEKKLQIDKNNITSKILFLLFATLFSNLGFGNFVSFVYPLFGFLGIIQIYCILKY